MASRIEGVRSSMSPASARGVQFVVANSILQHDRKYQDVITELSNLGGAPNIPPTPPLPPLSDSDRYEPVKADWEPRVERLELGFISACVAIFGAIIASYLLLSSSIDGVNDRLTNTTVAVTEVRGDVRVLSEKFSSANQKIDTIDKKAERIEAKLDKLIESK